VVSVACGLSPSSMGMTVIDVTNEEDLEETQLTNVVGMVLGDRAAPQRELSQALVYVLYGDLSMSRIFSRGKADVGVRFAEAPRGLGAIWTLDSNPSTPVIDIESFAPLPRGLLTSAMQMRLKGQ